MTSSQCQWWLNVAQRETRARTTMTQSAGDVAKEAGWMAVAQRKIKEKNLN